MAEEQIPKGFHFNSTEQKEKLKNSIRAVFAKLIDSGIGAVACVFVMPDGTMTAALAGDAEDPGALASLMMKGADVLQVTIERAKAGKGDTSIENVKEG